MKIKIFFAILSGLLLFSVSFGQRFTEDQLKKMLISPSLKNPVFFSTDKEACPNCKEIFIDGESFKQITHNNKVVVFNHFFFKDYVVINFGVQNWGKEEFVFDPFNSRLDFTVSSEILPPYSDYKTLSPIPAEKISAKIKSKANIANFFTVFAAGMSQSQTTSTGNVRVTDQNGNVATGRVESTSTAPNRAALDAANRRNAQRNQSTNETAAALETNALRKNTVFPGSSVDGFIYFKDVKFKRILLIFPIDGVDYVFMFAK